MTAHSPEHRQKLKDAALRRYQNPIERQIQSDRIKSLYHSTPSLHKMHGHEASKKRGKTLSTLWTTEHRVIETAKRISPEAVERSRAGAIRQWKTNRPALVESIRKAKRAHITKENQLLIENSDWLKEQNVTYTVTEISQRVGCAQSLVSNQFMKFGIIPKQHPISYTGGEQQVVDYLKSLGITNIIQRDRSVVAPLELDIYLPEFAVAIEYHGAYWHSYNHPESITEKRRHTIKDMVARANGIRLIQLWDYEWENQQDICKSIIRVALGKSISTGARLCELRQPTKLEVREFLQKNHIQGDRPYTLAVALYAPITNDMLMVMTFGKSRFRKCVWELLRFSTKLGYVIPGGAKRLWNAAIALIPTGTEIWSYSDKRLFTGKIYESLGFAWIHDTPPGYQYYLSGKPYSRMQFQKHKLATILPSFDITKTESENMFAAGYRRIWDAGQSVWSYKLS